jgi:hypothetical protein
MSGLTHGSLASVAGAAAVQLETVLLALPGTSASLLQLSLILTHISI